MNDLTSFYRNLIEKYAAELLQIKKQLFVSSMVRLTVFCVLAFAVYLFFGKLPWLLLMAVLGIGLFLYLVSRHQKLQYKRDVLKALVEINETEIRVSGRDFHHLSSGDKFKDAEHYYSQDIDLFGRSSFFQYANRTVLPKGSETLAGLLKENSISNIPDKQAAIQELATEPKWRQGFSAVASLVKTEVGSDTIELWLAGYRSFVPKVMRILPWIYSAFSSAILVLIATDVLPISTLVALLFLGLAITGRYTKKISRLTANATKAQNTFEQYNRLILQIEEREFKSEFLRQQKRKVTNESEKTSKIIKAFADHLESLDKNNNLIYLIFANGLFLRTLLHAYRTEQWIEKYSTSVPTWFETVAFFDAYNSFGNFAFNHPGYTYPTLSQGDIVLKSSQAGHPLLHPEKSVLNDLEIKSEEFFIITGANMAGKSTFLRTVSLQIVMANVGLPVCASAVSYSPIKLITSMRTSDSLADDESYFFSELKRLKFIVEELKKDRYFVILDEILKGTNSTDKAEGSQKFVKRLVASRSTGIIATHDLSLCDIAEEYPQIQNRYFDAEIVDDELHFDYKFKKGVCQNMNASFLLKKMDIV